MKAHFGIFMQHLMEESLKSPGPPNEEVMKS